MTGGASQPLTRATGLDHVVLVVADPETSVDWYRRVLGLEAERLEEWERGEVLFPSVRLDATTVIDLFPGEVTGKNVDHLAVVVEGADLDAIAASGEVDVVAGPSELWGAQGYGSGLYITDPDGHMIELRTYPTR